MDAHLTPEPPVLDADVEPADGPDLSVEPVESVASADTPVGRERAHGRIRLRLRVAALEAALARARRRRAIVVDQYERALEGRADGESPAFSWRH